MLGHLPWVSMAEALSDLGPWAGGTPSLQWKLVVRNGGYEPGGKFSSRDADEPAPTVIAHFGRRDSDTPTWATSRPSTTVCADPRVSPPVHHHGSQTAGAVPWTDAGADKPIVLTEAQGVRLMGMPDGTADVLEGTKADRWRIIGNAVCPPVATAVLTQLTTPTPHHNTQPHQ